MLLIDNINVNNLLSDKLSIDVINRNSTKTNRFPGGLLKMNKILFALFLFLDCNP